jgi:NAD(P)H-dependent FMN reductase
MVLSLLRELFEERGDEARVVSVRDLRLGHCTGCFGCFVENPGLCRLKDDAGAIVAAIVNSDELVFVTGVSFGGYSAMLKRMVDRVLPTLLPYFLTVGGESHHPHRYDRRQRLLAIGLQQRHDAREASVFESLAARNAINFHASSHAALVVVASETPATVRARLRASLARRDSRLFRRQVEALLPSPHPLREGPPRSPPRRALLVVGSPKVGPSTSAVVGAHLLAKLRAGGVQTSTLVLKGSLQGPRAEQGLVAAVEAADLIVLSFPLYVDSLPHLVTLALEVLGRRQAEWVTTTPKTLIAICNSGFPEPHQNAVALAICERFASAMGMHFAGGLAIGSGEAISGGLPLSGPGRTQGPPAVHVIRALDATAEALATGRNAPEVAEHLLAKSPIPRLPFFAWRYLFRVFGGAQWNRMAALHGNTPRSLLARPHSAQAGTARAELRAD